MGIDTNVKDSTIIEKPVKAVPEEEGGEKQTSDKSEEGKKEEVKEEPRNTLFGVLYKQKIRKPRDHKPELVFIDDVHIDPDLDNHFVRFSQYINLIG